MPQLDQHFTLQTNRNTLDMQVSDLLIALTAFKPFSQQTLLLIVSSFIFGSLFLLIGLVQLTFLRFYKLFFTLKHER